MLQDERGGITLAMAGFALLSVGDAVAKTMAGEWSPLAVAALRFTLGAAALSILLLRAEGPRGFVPEKPWLQVARGACLAAATLLFFSAIFLMPLANAMALVFVSPMFVAFFSALFLKEKVRGSVIAASLAALVGVAMILRPNLAELGWVAALPLGTAVFFALMVVANRASAGQGSALSMQAFISLGAAPLLVLAAWIGGESGVPRLGVSWPDWTIVARCALVACTASTAHWLVYKGTMRAGASTIAPTTYVQMLVATFFGWWWFGDVPDPATLGGAAIIVGAGVFLWWNASARRSGAVAETD